MYEVYASVCRAGAGATRCGQRALDLLERLG
jgi:hypothetical protein